MRLIDADVLEEQFGISDEDIIAKEIIGNAPTIDAVSVVRCRECKHRGTDDCPMHIKGVPADEDFLKVVDNDFCSYGERRSNNK